MRSALSRFLDRVREYDRIAKIGEIGRRYFAMNSFDGILTILGILLGSYFAGISNARIIITTGFGACIAMGVSGIWGTYLAEEAERNKALRDLERATLTRMKNTKIQKAAKFAIISVALIDGLSPFFAALVVILPFIVLSFLPIKLIYLISIMIAFILLISLGIFLGTISRENIIKSGLKMALAGVVCVVLSLLLQFY
ncbi:hypothetical protein JW930_04270 [Candidatus Woesearchaeota archaeon]|nr:hypothetical protein [Candidatus Woesearchaeota archaeon]